MPNLTKKPDGPDIESIKAKLDLEGRYKKYADENLGFFWSVVEFAASYPFDLDQKDLHSVESIRSALNKYDFNKNHYESVAKILHLLATDTKFTDPVYDYYLDNKDKDNEKKTNINVITTLLTIEKTLTTNPSLQSTGNKGVDNSKKDDYERKMKDFTNEMDTILTQLNNISTGTHKGDSSNLLYKKELEDFIKTEKGKLDDLNKKPIKIKKSKGLGSFFKPTEINYQEMVPELDKLRDDFYTEFKKKEYYLEFQGDKHKFYKERLKRDNNNTDESIVHNKKKNTPY